jgi:predicted NAD-dependent protein-ADP-ribosyltransferase YbiA (DUF1768 family)
MRVILKPGVLALACEGDEEQAELAEWGRTAAGHVFRFDGGSLRGAAFHDLGAVEDACREPINIVFDGPDEWRPISNLAETPFVLDGRTYASVEGFWQGLKVADADERRRIAALSGLAAKRAGQALPQPEVLIYEGERIAAGGPAHRDLMFSACRAKFKQNALARETLLATGERPLTHRVRRDSRTIPGALMADIWMRLRAELRGGEAAV